MTTTKTPKSWWAVSPTGKVEGLMGSREWATRHCDRLGYAGPFDKLRDARALAASKWGGWQVERDHSGFAAKKPGLGLYWRFSTASRARSFIVSGEAEKLAEAYAAEDAR